MIRRHYTLIFEMPFLRHATPMPAFHLRQIRRRRLRRFIATLMLHYAIDTLITLLSPHYAAYFTPMPLRCCHYFTLLPLA